MIDKVGTGKSVGSASPDSRWVTVAFTWNGLRALGVDEASLATFPEEFRQGMAARAEIVGATGRNHPDNWVGELASPALHAIGVLFARDVAERERCKQEHDRYLSQIDGVERAFRVGFGGDSSRRSTRTFRVSRSTVAADDRGNRRAADAGLGSAHQSGRVLPRLPR